MEEVMSSMFPRVYRSFDEFERAELRKLDHMYESVDGMLDEILAAEMEEERHCEDNGILFDEIDD